MLTHDYEKPEMPEPDGSMTIMMIGSEVEIDTYRTSTMVEYRDACVEAATAPLLARIAELENELKWKRRADELLSVEVPDDAPTTSGALSAAPAAQPMTQQEVVDAFCQQPHPVQYVVAFEQGVRYAEKRLGIKEQP